MAFSVGKVAATAFLVVSTLSVACAQVETVLWIRQSHGGSEDCLQVDSTGEYRLEHWHYQYYSGAQASKFRAGQFSPQEMEGLLAILNEPSLVALPRQTKAGEIYQTSSDSTGISIYRTGGRQTLEFDDSGGLYLYDSGGYRKDRKPVLPPASSAKPVKPLLEWYKQTLKRKSGVDSSTVSVCNNLPR